MTTKLVVLAAKVCPFTGNKDFCYSLIFDNFNECKRFIGYSEFEGEVRFVPLSNIPYGMFLIDFFNQEWEDALNIDELREYWYDN